MEARDILLSAVMVISAFVLTYRWLGQYGLGDSVVVLAAMVLVGALAALLLSIDIRLGEVENKIDAKERSLRVNIQGVEDNVDRKLNMMLNRVNEALESLTRRQYR